MIPKDRYLVKQAFQNLNDMKRYQTQEELERHKGRHDLATQFELRKIKAMMRLELSLRAIQRETFNSSDDDDDEDYDDDDE